MNSYRKPSPPDPGSPACVDVVLRNAEDPDATLRGLRDAFDCAGVQGGLAVVEASSACGTSPQSWAMRDFRVVTPSGSEPGAGFAHALRRGYGAWVLMLNGHHLDPAAAFSTLWEARNGHGLVAAVNPPTAGNPGGVSAEGFLSHCTNRVVAGMLHLPVVDPFSPLFLCRREALQHGIREGGGRVALFPFSVMAHVCSAGYGIREVPLDHGLLEGPGRARDPKQRMASLLPALAAARRVRNSFRSADYDYRAHFSLRPAQRYWQRRRYRLVAEMVGRANGILDVGSGSSYFSATFPGVTAMDLNPSKVRFLKRFNSRTVCGDAERMPFPDASFSTVVCSVVIEHIPGDRAIPECIRVLKPGGDLIIGTPDYDSWQWPLIERVYGWLHPDGYAEDHVRRYTREGLRRELTAAGMEIVAEEDIFGGEVFFHARKNGAADRGGSR